MKFLFPYSKEALLFAHTKNPVFSVLEPSPTDVTTVLDKVTLEKALEFITKGNDFQYYVNITNGNAITYAKGKLLRYDRTKYSLKEMREGGYIYE